MRSGRALSFFLALLINAALFAGSAYAVFRVLTARRPPGPSVKLGLPRQVAETALVFEWPTWWRFPLGTDGETLTYPPAEATDGADAAGVARRPKGKRRHAGRRKRRLAAGKVGGGGWRAAGGGSGSSAGSGSASAGGSDDGSDHGSDHGSGAAVTGSASGSDRGSAAGSGAAGGSGSSNGSGSALSEGDRRRAAFDAGSIRLVVRQHLPQIQACYLRALKRKRNLRGNVDIALVLHGNGTPKSATVHANSTGHEGLGKCIAYNMARWRYPRPVSGQESRFIYPFAFAPSENK